MVLFVHTVFIVLCDPPHALTKGAKSTGKIQAAGAAITIITDRSSKNYMHALSIVVVANRIESN